MVYQLPVRYLPGGVDLRLPETLHDPTAAIDGLNFDITPSSDLVKRLGYAMRATDAQGYGLVNYEKRTVTLSAAIGFGDFAFGQDPFGSPTTLGFGDISYELVGLSASPAAWTAGILEITYSGGNTADVTISANSSSAVECVLRENGSAVLTVDLGDGTEGTPVTVSSLATSISAVSDWSASVTAGTSTIPAAFLDWYYQESLTSGTPFNAGFGEWTTINCPISSPLAAVDTRKGRAGFENPTAVSLDGIMYVGNGYDSMYKYDTQNLYKAGLKQATTPSTANDTGTTVAAGMSGEYKYKVAYKQVDKLGNILEGRISGESTALDNSAGPYEIDVTLTNILAAEGYNTNCAIVDGTQTSVTQNPGIERLTVDDGSGGAHTLKVGDTAYLYDKNQSAYATFTVSAVGANTLDLESSATISVDDNIPISNNLRIVIYRTVGGGSTFKLVAEVPNDSFNSTQVYADNLIDSSLGAEEIIPLKTPALPPKGKYHAVWRNQLIVAGDPTAPSRIYYSEFSDTVSAENFPATNFVEVSPGVASGPITGIAVSGRNLFVFTEDTAYVVEGNLAQDSARIDLISDNVGCMAHATIQVIDTTIYFLSKKGVYRIRPAQAGFAVENISRALDPVFRQGANNEFREDIKRAMAASWDAQRKYVLYMPDTTLLGGEYYSNSNSRCYVYDLDRNQWYIWDNIHALGGLVEFNDDVRSGDVLWFHTRENVSSTVKKRLHRFNNTKTEIDYADHVAAVNFEYRPQWEFSASPRTRKLYKDMSIDTYRLASDLAFTPSGTMTVTTYRDFDRNTSEVTFTFDFLSNDEEIIKPLPRSMRRALGIKFSNSTINKQILVSGWGFEVLNMIREMRR